MISSCIVSILTSLGEKCIVHRGTNTDYTKRWLGHLIIAFSAQKKGSVLFRKEE